MSDSIASQSSASEDTLPRWDLSTVFPSLDCPEFALAMQAIQQRSGELATLADTLNVRRRSDPEIDETFIEAFERLCEAINGFMEPLRTLGSYLGCLVTTDARDERARAQSSLLDAPSIRFSKVYTRFLAWVGSSDIEELLRRSAVAQQMEHPIRRARELEKHQMSEGEEDLGAELAPSGINAWERLHGNMTALLTGRVPLDGEEKTLPISAIRALGSHPDRKIRNMAFEEELRQWESVNVPLAAALNGVKGYQGTLNRRRGYADDLEPTLGANGIDRETLSAMQEACVESFPDFRRYLDAKARSIGVGQMAWFDLAAPVAGETRSWSWPEAETFIRDHFGRYSSRLSQFADQAFSQKWIDAGPRVGKEGGAYCTGIKPGESRVMMNFDGSFTSVSTLAHELGHAYHNLNLKDRVALQRRTPMTLAETASIFCETLSFDAAIEKATKDERLALLDTALQRNLQVVVDIHSRFLFETAVFHRRRDRELNPSEFNDLMVDAQKLTYGEGLAAYHPYMWALKGHYYGASYYNYPYTFGLLFGLGLYARYEAEPESFKREYDEFLSSTGLADARTLAARFGIQTDRVEFWRSSLDVIRRDIDRFEQLVTGAG